METNILMDIIRNIITPIVALIALIRPWFWALWARLFQQGRIEIYHTGTLEIGYSLYGPTIGLNGTLRGLHKDLFVRSIILELTRMKDSAKHTFEWALFRSQKMTLSGEQQGSFELPYGFMLSTAFPYRYNVQFHDMQLQAEQAQLMSSYSEEWNNIRNHGLLPHGTASPAEISGLTRDLYERFKSTPLAVKTYTDLGRLSYWEAGKYILKMKILTPRANRSFEKEWKFTLTESQVNSVNLNVLKILEDYCGQTSFDRYFFAFPKYE